MPWPWIASKSFAQTPARDTTSRLLALEGKVEVARAGQAAWTTGWLAGNAAAA